MQKRKCRKVWKSGKSESNTHQQKQKTTTPNKNRNPENPKIWICFGGVRKFGESTQRNRRVRNSPIGGSGGFLLLLVDMVGYSCCCRCCSYGCSPHLYPYVACSPFLFLPVLRPYRWCWSSAVGGGDDGGFLVFFFSCCW